MQWNAAGLMENIVLLRKEVFLFIDYFYITIHIGILILFHYFG